MVTLSPYPQSLPYGNIRCNLLVTKYFHYLHSKIIFYEPKRLSPLYIGVDTEPTNFGSPRDEREQERWKTN